MVSSDPRSRESDEEKKELQKKCCCFIDGDVRITYFAVVFMSMEAKSFKLSRVLIQSLLSTEELRHVRTTCDFVHPIISITLFSV